MNFTKHIEYKPNKQIWRIVITDDEKVVIEKRDTNDKQVYFDSFELNSKEKVFTDLQLDEKFWIGIEKIYKNVIYFHLFAKPDMPGHKEIIAYDIVEDKILWRDEEHSYLFIYNDKVYSFKQLFEGRQFYTLDYKTGELLEDLGTYTKKVNSDYDKSRQEEDYSDYIFPESIKSNEERVSNLLEELKSELAIVGEVEYNVYKHALLVSYHTKQSNGKINNNFVAIDIESKQEIINTTLSEEVDSFMTDSFFVYKNFLFLLKGKGKLIIYKID